MHVICSYNWSLFREKVGLRASRDVKSQFELHAKASPFHEHQKEEIPKDRMTEYALSYR